MLANAVRLFRLLIGASSSTFLAISVTDACFRQRWRWICVTHAEILAWETATDAHRMSAVLAALLISSASVVDRSTSVTTELESSSEAEDQPRKRKRREKKYPTYESDTDSEPVAQKTRGVIPQNAATLPFIPPPCFTANSQDHQRPPPQQPCISANSHDQHHLNDISWNTRRLGSVGETLTGNGIFTVTPPERHPPFMSPDFSYPELSTLNASDGRDQGGRGHFTQLMGPTTPRNEHVFRPTFRVGDDSGPIPCTGDFALLCWRGGH
ncbi:uncharacterized protein LOC117559015 [Gymnodraco acuticeps]|uniref:Uncharacterized protein LOC117559015 n=1 Tax=Gymnodraco acuticeps TaxID=8218 RepID=A0A6P8VLL1_GYMAC|nr:uncharacterized protein LOC117559015 [Gymnodraco acuticeps]